MKWEIPVARILKISGIVFMLLDLPNVILIAYRYWHLPVQGSFSPDGFWVESLALALVPIAQAARTLVFGFGAIGLALILERMSRREA